MEDFSEKRENSRTGTITRQITSAFKFLYLEKMIVHTKKCKFLQLPSY